MTANTVVLSAMYDALPEAAKNSLTQTLQLFLAVMKNYALPTRDALPSLPLPTPLGDQREYARRRRRFREQLVERIWEPDLRRDLVEYIMFALDNRWTDEYTLNDIIDAARKDKETGKVDRMWRVIGSWLRGVIEGAGQPWCPTKGAPEPRPAKLQEETNKKKREARAVKKLEKELALE